MQGGTAAAAASQRRGQQTAPYRATDHGCPERLPESRSSRDTHLRCAVGARCRLEQPLRRDGCKQGRTSRRSTMDKADLAASPSPLSHDLAPAVTSGATPEPVLRASRCRAGLAYLQVVEWHRQRCKMQGVHLKSSTRTGRSGVTMAPCQGQLGHALQAETAGCRQASRPTPQPCYFALHFHAAAAICSISSTLVSLSRGLACAAPRRTSSASTASQPLKSTTWRGGSGQGATGEMGGGRWQRGSEAGTRGDWRQRQGATPRYTSPRLCRPPRCQAHGQPPTTVRRFAVLSPVQASLCRCNNPHLHAAAV